jgi:CRP-like cAMP-binding protein
MRDIHPAHLRRILKLRRFALFAAADVDELATIAENVTEMSLPPGAVIVADGARVPAIHLVLDGRIATHGDERVWEGGAVVGALEVFANHIAGYTAATTTRTETLRILAADVAEIVEDSFGVLNTVLRELAVRVTARHEPVQRLEMPSGAMPGGLGLVERLVMLRQQLPFGRARLQALATLAHASEELEYEPGALIVRAGETASHGYVITDGTASSVLDTAESTLVPGNSFGHLAAIAGGTYTATVRATSQLRALRSSTSAIVDVIEDHTDVGIAMIATLASQLLDRH